MILLDSTFPMILRSILASRIDLWIDPWIMSESPTLTPPNVTAHSMYCSSQHWSMPTQCNKGPRLGVLKLTYV